jgi:hypothetical protein
LKGKSFVDVVGLVIAVEFEFLAVFVSSFAAGSFPISSKVSSSQEYCFLENSLANILNYSSRTLTCHLNKKEMIFRAFNQWKLF